jgi:hypothetical protein
MEIVKEMLRETGGEALYSKSNNIKNGRAFICYYLTSFINR